jgi:hypothetical protein
VIEVSITKETKNRQFDTGATRDTDTGKLDYEGFLSPMVLQRYAQYMHKHQTQSNGQLRDSDNWQKLFGEEHFDVCMKSAFRHFMDWWGQHRGLESEKDLAESICALLFNAMAYLHKMELQKKRRCKRDEPIHILPNHDTYCRKEL